MNPRRSGITILELLVVLAIVGILAAIGTTSWFAAARRTASQGAVATFQQSVWQGATAAAARGVIVELVREGDQLRLLNVNNGNAVLRSYDLPAGVVIPADNPILRFLPPGKIEMTSLETVAGGLAIETSDGSYHLDISIIGEVRSQLVSAD